MPLLRYELNQYGGAVVDSSSLPEEGEEFLSRLRATVALLREEGRNTLWLSLPLERAAFVPLATGEGFRYHHAGEEVLQLVLRLIPQAFVPPYATHYIGAGGVLLDDQTRILVVQERFHTRRHYKLPGGALNPGEHIAHAVVREVEEETGIRSAFRYLSCFRHWHGYRFGKSDIYFVCRLDPLSFELTPDPTEITEAIWMPLEEYLNHPDTHSFNRKIVEATLREPGLRVQEIPGYGSPESHEMLFL